MSRFRKFCFTEDTVKSVARGSSANVLRETLELVEYHLNNNWRFRRLFIAEAKAKAKAAQTPGSRFKDDYRRHLDPSEEEMMTHLQQRGGEGGKGMSPHQALKSIFGGPGYLQAVQHYAKALGMDADTLGSLKRGEIRDIDFDKVSPQQVRKSMRGAGVPIFTDPKWKEVLEKAVLRSVRDKTQGGQQLDKIEQAVYAKWQDIMQEVGPTVGNRQRTEPYKPYERPTEKHVLDLKNHMAQQGHKMSDDEIKSMLANPFTADRYDDLMMRTMNPRLRDPSDKQRSQFGRNLNAHFNPFREADEEGWQQSYPSEIALNVDDAYVKIKAKHGDILTDEQAELMFLSKVRDDLIAGKAFVPKPGTADQDRRYQRWAQTMMGTAGASTGISNPVTNPGEVQSLTGRVRPIQGKKFGDIEDHPKMPEGGSSPYISLGKERVAFPDAKINKLYNTDHEARRNEIEKPAKVAARKYLKHLKPDEYEDAVQDISTELFGVTGIDGWRDSEPLRQHWAKLIAFRFREKLMRRMTREKSGLQKVGDPDSIDLTAAAAGKGFGDMSKKAQPMGRKERSEIEKRASGSENELLDMGLEGEDAIYAKEIADILSRAQKDRDSVDHEEMVDAIDKLKNLSAKYPAIDTWVRKQIEG